MAEAKVFQFPGANPEGASEEGFVIGLPAVTDAFIDAVHLLHDRDLATRANEYGILVPKDLLGVTLDSITDTQALHHKGK